MTADVCTVPSTSRAGANSGELGGGGIHSFEEKHEDLTVYWLSSREFPAPRTGRSGVRARRLVH
jgi:hypothetical protein